MDPELVSHITSYISPKYNFLKTAVAEDNVDMISFIHESGITRIYSLNTLLYKAVKSRSMNVVKYAIEAGAEIDKTTSVYYCTLKGEKFNKVLQYLLEQGANPRRIKSYHHNSPFENAVEQENMEAIQLLLDHGIVARTGDLSLVKTLQMAQFLVQKGAIPTSLLLLGLISGEQPTSSSLERERILSFYVEQCGVHIRLYLLLYLLKCNNLEAMQYLICNSLFPIPVSLLQEVLMQFSKIPLLASENLAQDLATREKILCFIVEQISIRE
jgi:hypothetical protein